MLDLDDILARVEEELYNRIHADACSCREWPDYCVSYKRGRAGARFTLNPADVLAAAAPLIAGQVRQDTADTIARAIEQASGHRCPACGGMAASTKHPAGANWGSAPISRCGAGHTWQTRTSHLDATKAAAIARRAGDGDRTATT